MKNAFFTVHILLSVLQVEVNGEDPIFIDHDEVAVIDRLCPLTKKNAAGRNTVFVIAGSFRHNAETLVCLQPMKSLNVDGSDSVG